MGNTCKPSRGRDHHGTGGRSSFDGPDKLLQLPPLAPHLAFEDGEITVATPRDGAPTPREGHPFTPPYKMKTTRATLREDLAFENRQEAALTPRPPAAPPRSAVPRPGNRRPGYPSLLSLVARYVDSSDALAFSLASRACCQARREAAGGSPLVTPLKEGLQSRPGRIEWARSSGMVPESVASDVAREGDLPTLMWLATNGFPVSPEVCSDAARGGHTHVIQWLRNQGYEWGRYCCSSAARGGHVEMLAWLRSQGCPWGKDPLEAAKKAGQKKAVAWLEANGATTIPQGGGAGRIWFNSE